MARTAIERIKNAEIDSYNAKIKAQQSADEIIEKAKSQANMIIQKITDAKDAEAKQQLEDTQKSCEKIINEAKSKANDDAERIIEQARKKQNEVNKMVIDIIL